ncbi:MAG: PAS domain S-box protein [Spirochaetota bacterium]|nr:PAS domain S-box protein [Spirochaetota bacterium]
MDQSKISLLLESSLNEIYVFDENSLLFLYVNSAALNNLGYSQKQILSMTPVDIKPELELDDFQEMVTPLRTSESQKLEFQTIHERADGTRYPVEVHLQLIDWDDGRVFLAMILDITERIESYRSLRESERTLKEAQRIAHIGNWHWNIITGALLWSDEIFRIFGLKPQQFEATYEAFLETIHPDDRQLVMDSVDAAVLGNENYDLVHRIILPDGEIRHIHERGEVTFDPSGKPTDMIGTVRDITDRVRQDEIIQFHIAELEKNNKELEEFNYVASHDLQEPLRALSSFSTLLSQDLEKKDFAKVNDDLNFIQTAAKRMHQVVQDMLSLSRVGRAVLRLDAVDLNDCVATVLSDMRPKIMKYKARVTCKKLPVVEGDWAQLTRVIQNLLSNALKFHNSAPLDIRIFCESNDEYCDIHIKDNGIGIEERYHEQIFLPFKRLNSPSDYQGSGIGLTISKRIIDRHSGKILVQSKPGQGSDFIVRLKSWRDNT